jgi:hypothetical protein
VRAAQIAVVLPCAGLHCQQTAAEWPCPDLHCQQTAAELPCADLRVPELRGRPGAGARRRQSR